MFGLFLEKGTVQVSKSIRVLLLIHTIRLFKLKCSGKNWGAFFALHINSNYGSVKFYNEAHQVQCFKNL